VADKRRGTGAGSWGKQRDPCELNTASATDKQFPCDAYLANQSAPGKGGRLSAAWELDWPHGQNVEFGQLYEHTLPVFCGNEDAL